MQLNHDGLKKFRHIYAIIGAVILFIIGVAFIVLTAYVFAHPESLQEAENGIVFPIVFMIAGIVACILSVFMVIRRIKLIKKIKPLTEEEVKANEAKFAVNTPYIENIQNEKFFFHFGGKLNQSYFVENQSGETVYQCLLRKFNLFGANTFEFIDVKNKYSKMVKIGKVLNTSDNDITVGSSFKIDGVRCWDYLRERGYEIKQMLNGKTILRNELYKLNKLVANIYLCDIKDPFNEDSKKIFRMGNGAYRLEIIDAKLEDVVMAAFIITQVEVVE